MVDESMSCHFIAHGPCRHTRTTIYLVTRFPVLPAAQQLWPKQVVSRVAVLSLKAVSKFVLDSIFLSFTHSMYQTRPPNTPRSTAANASCVPIPASISSPLILCASGIQRVRSLSTISFADTAVCNGGTSSHRLPTYTTPDPGVSSTAVSMCETAGESNSGTLFGSGEYL